MPKTFDYASAKEQIKFYKKLLRDLKNNSAFPKDYQDNIRSQLQILNSYDFFSSLVEQGLNGKPLDLQNSNIQIFIANIYYFKENCKYADACKSLYDTYITQVNELMSNLSFGSNALLWLFSSKHKKQIIEESYSKLVEMRHEYFVTSSENILDSIKNIDKTNIATIIDDFLIDKSKYWECLTKANVIDPLNNVSIKLFQKYETKYNSLVKRIDRIKNKIQKRKDDIKNAVTKLLSEELVNLLRSVSIDELSKEKTGIKIKYLRDAGFNNFADIFGASRSQIASIYGISEDMSYTIKSKCDDYVEKIKNEVKIKLSLDNKSKSATDVIYAIYHYILEKDSIIKIDELNNLYDDHIKSDFDLLCKIGAGVKWPFLDDEEINSVILAYNDVKDTLSSKYEIMVLDIIKEFNSISKKDDDAWIDFSNNSIKYYNVIEEICPNILGTDDTIYGLSEELARQIQEECFFPDGLLCTLRKYQEWGVKYILHQRNVLLGDEMGLGKTIQAIATMVSLKNVGATHFLVVCPASVVTNWCREIGKHSRLRYIMIHGRGKVTAFQSWLKTGGVAVTNYESISYIELEENYKFSLLVIDEAHYIKNATAKRSVITRNLATHAERLLFMTGTALENNVDEMISLIEILNPSIANSVRGFTFMASAPQFRQKIAPVYYRRKREDVLTELPDKIESKEWCVLNDYERDAYEKAVLDNKFHDARRVSWNIDDLNKSSKAQRLKEIVSEAEFEGRKVLVFSFFLNTISKIYDFLKGKCLNPINGSVNVNRRQEIIDEFNSAPAGTVLLAQINSGGTGLNIQSASIVIVCEPQLKPSIENQAISRAYRMGQSRNVLVYKLLCTDTIDERINEVLEEKQKLFDAFADKSDAAQQSLDIDNKTLTDIINEEKERIKNSRANDSSNVKIIKENKNHNNIDLSMLKKYDYTPITVFETGKDYYSKIMKMSYEELVKFLIDKYGPVKHDYFLSEYCVSKDKKGSRTSEGLIRHHIDEDKFVLLSDTKYAVNHSFEFQKANRLVYCNILEHLFLHILIFEKNSLDDELKGIGGAIIICKQLNDMYNGYIYKKKYYIDLMTVVENDYDSYILMLRRLWQDIQKSNLFISKEDLSTGWNDNVYSRILKELK